MVISRHIVELMGGRIWLDSEEGIGSTFHFTVNLIKPQKKSIEDDDFERKAANDNNFSLEQLRGRKVLLAEDHKINQELVMALLISQGMAVECANNGKEALDLLSQEKFDSILMDCQMPVMDGYEATRKIREQEQYRNLPVIALTASVMKGDREEVPTVGMNDHIAKPTSPDVLFTTIAKWISISQ